MAKEYMKRVVFGILLSSLILGRCDSAATFNSSVLTKNSTCATLDNNPEIIVHEFDDKLQLKVLFGFHEMPSDEDLIVECRAPYPVEWTPFGNQTIPQFFSEDKNSCFRASMACVASHGNDNCTGSYICRSQEDPTKVSSMYKFNSHAGSTLFINVGSKFKLLSPTATHLLIPCKGKNAQDRADLYQENPLSGKISKLASTLVKSYNVSEGYTLDPNSFYQHPITFFVCLFEEEAETNGLTYVLVRPDYLKEVDAGLVTEESYETLIIICIVLGLFASLLAAVVIITCRHLRMQKKASLVDSAQAMQNITEVRTNGVLPFNINENQAATVGEYNRFN